MSRGFSYVDKLILNDLHFCYGMDGPGIKSRRGARFFAPVQSLTWVQPVSCTTDTGSFSGVKRPGRGVDHPPHLPPKLKK